MSYTVPNWAQSQMAKAAGLDPAGVGVELENDTSIVFLQYLPRKRILVSKADGSIIDQQDKFADSRRHGHQIGQLKLPQ